MLVFSVHHHPRNCLCGYVGSKTWEEESGEWRERAESPRLRVNGWATIKLMDGFNAKYYLLQLNLISVEMMEMLIRDENELGQSLKWHSQPTGPI